MLVHAALIFITVCSHVVMDRVLCWGRYLCGEHPILVGLVSLNIRLELHDMLLTNILYMQSNDKSSFSLFILCNAMPVLNTDCLNVNFSSSQDTFLYAEYQNAHNNRNIPGNVCVSPKYLSVHTVTRREVPHGTTLTPAGFG